MAESGQKIEILFERLYVQLYRTLRRSMAAAGNLERSKEHPWQKVAMATRFIGSIDAEIISFRDLVEEIAAELSVTLPPRGEATKLAKGVNAHDPSAGAIGPAQPSVADSEV